MVNLSSLQTKIGVKIFDNIGSTVTYAAVTHGSTDKWGDATNTYATATSITSVPWFHIKGREDWNPFGDLEEGEIDMAFKYNQALTVKSRVTFGGDTYLIKEVEEFPIKDGILVKVARLRKEH